jgi:hypothetical protein
VANPDLSDTGADYLPNEMAQTRSALEASRIGARPTRMMNPTLAADAGAKGKVTSGEK